jgi:hypothetical protein
MEPSLNRVEKDLHAWKRQEAKCAELFTPQVLHEKAFLQGKLDFYDRIHNRYAKSATDEEKILLQVLKGERKKLESILFPGMVGKLSRSVDLLLHPKNEKKPEQLEVLKNAKIQETPAPLKTHETKKETTAERVQLKNAEQENKLKTGKASVESNAQKNGLASKREQIKNLLPQKENGNGLKLK